MSSRVWYLEYVDTASNSQKFYYVVEDPGSTTRAPAALVGWGRIGAKAQWARHAYKASEHYRDDKMRRGYCVRWVDSLILDRELGLATTGSFASLFSTLENLRNNRNQRVTAEEPQREPTAVDGPTAHYNDLSGLLISVDATLRAFPDDKGAAAAQYSSIADKVNAVRQDLETLDGYLATMRLLLMTKEVSA